MSDISWKTLSVQDFLSRYSQVQADISVSRTEEKGLPSDHIWQKRSVAEFFHSIPWSPVNTVTDLSEPFGLSLSVQTYFQYFQWNAPVKALKSPITSPPVDEPLPTFDVQKFSDLF